MSMYITCLDLEGVLVPEIWIAFAEATSELAGKGFISIWMDDKCISAPSVNSAITDGECVIEGKFTYDSAKALSDKINEGSIPFDLKTTSTNIIWRVCKELNGACSNYRIYRYRCIYHHYL